MCFPIREYTFVQARTKCPIYLDGRGDLSIGLDASFEEIYSEMLNGESQIILPTTAIVLYPISELIEMDVALHMIQI